MSITDATSWYLNLRRVADLAKQLLEPCPADPPEDGVRIGIREDRTPVYWPAPTARTASHVLCLAASGAGKSVLTANAIIEEIRAGLATAEPENRHSVIVLDPKGDLIELVLHGLAAVPSEEGHDVLSDIVYLNPFEQGFPFNLNKLSRGSKTPLDIRALQLANLVSELSTSAGSQRHLGTGARQVDTLQCCLLGALDCGHPDASVLWALDALSTAHGMKALAAVTRSARARQFLTTAKLSDELRASCASRLRTAFAATSDIESMVASESCIQIADLVAPGRITLIDLGQPPGGMNALQSFFANMLLRLIVDHLSERPSPWKGHHCRLVIDEAQVVAPVLSDVAERCLTQGRSRGFSLTALSQGTALIHAASPTLLQTMLANTRTRIVGRLAAQDAELLARSLTARQGVDVTTCAVRARFVSAVTNNEDRAFFLLQPGSIQRFTSKEVDLAAWQQAAEMRAAQIEAAKTRFAIQAGAGQRRTLSDVVPRSTSGRGSRKPAQVVRSPWG